MSYLKNHSYLFVLPQLAMQLTILNCFTLIQPVNANSSDTLKTFDEWSTIGLKVLIGTIQKPYFVSVQAPERFVNFAQSLLQGEPRTWNVIPDFDDPNLLPGKEVYFIGDARGNIITVMIQPHCWTRIENPDWPVKSKLTNYKANPDILKDPDNISKWMVDLIDAYTKANMGLIMNKYQRNNISTLFGSNIEKNNWNKFYALFYDPIITQQGMLTAICCNNLTWGGAVYEWTFIVQAVYPIKILSIRVKKLYPPGTFLYPYSD